MGLIKIKQKKIECHKKNMLLAFAASTLFLICYIIYHTYHGDQKFMGVGFIRPIYFFILISHIGLSVITLPMVLLTFSMAYLKSWEKHSKLAKWTAPLWLYVSVTGVLIVIFLKTFN
jgi:putative membrane protein